MRHLPHYPIYVPSAGRAEVCKTPAFLLRDRVPFYLVVQPCERDKYATRFPDATILELPWNNDGRKDGLLRARNWIRDHAEKKLKAKMHWQLDDNIRKVMRRFKGEKVACESGPAFKVVEDFVDRYENVGVAGMNYECFVFRGARIPPFFLNVHVYSCTLVNHAMPYRWRLNYNDDTDLCLQALAHGWCTVLVNAFMAQKMATMQLKGGNTDDLYKIDDGRLRMAHALRRQWPRVVTVDRRFHRPQHVVRNQWRGFDTQLKLRKGVRIDAKPNEYGLELHRPAYWKRA